MSCTPGNHTGQIVPRRKDAIWAVWWCLGCEKRVGSRRVAVDLLTADDRHALRPVPKPKKRRRPGKRRRQYLRFLHSAAWKLQRARVLARDGYTCACGAEATDGAHVRYASRIEETPDQDIVASCGPCNRAEKEARILGRRSG